MKKLNTLEMEKIYGASGVDTRTHSMAIVATTTTRTVGQTGPVTISKVLSLNTICL
ncbi:type 2 lantibiotic [Bacillus thuringiensis]